MSGGGHANRPESIRPWAKKRPPALEATQQPTLFAHLDGGIAWKGHATRSRMNRASLLLSSTDIAGSHRSFILQRLRWPGSKR